MVVALLPFESWGPGDVNAAEKATAESSFETFLMTSILVGCLALGGFSSLKKEGEREWGIFKNAKKIILAQLQLLLGRNSLDSLLHTVMQFCRSSFINFTISSASHSGSFRSNGKHLMISVLHLGLLRMRMWLQRSLLVQTTFSFRPSKNIKIKLCQDSVQVIFTTRCGLYLQYSRPTELHFHEVFL